MKILSVIQLKDIIINDEKYPIGRNTQIILDKRNPSNKKEHQLIYQQSIYYGEIGDKCKYLNNEELFELEEKGFISIKKTK